VIPAAYPAKMELRIEVEENDGVVPVPVPVPVTVPVVLESMDSSEAIMVVGTIAPTAVGCNEVVAIVGVGLGLVLVTEHVLRVCIP
jgi:hypothetical protein